MKKKHYGVFAAVCALAMTGVWALPAGAQSAEVKEKPRMYTYVSNWSIPRARWGDMEKQEGVNSKILDKGISSGALVGYGYDVNLVHQADGDTHDTFWSSMSWAGILSVLEELKAASAGSAPLAAATKHSDSVFVSTYYNWKSGSVKGGYTHGAAYKLKDSAPNDALDTLAKTFIVPLMEKLLADGTVQQYEVDEQAIHTQNPGMFWIFYITSNAGDLDKVSAALGAAFKSNALYGPAFDSMVDLGAHHDELAKTDATYK